MYLMLMGLLLHGGTRYDMDQSVSYQDNMSVILLETNGKASRSKRTKQVKVKYFYVKEKVDYGDIVIEHCVG
jgi:hypothetical protein